MSVTAYVWGKLCRAGEVIMHKGAVSAAGPKVQRREVETAQSPPAGDGLSGHGLFIQWNRAHNEKEQTDTDICNIAKSQ